MTDALPPSEDLDVLAAAIVDGDADEALLHRLDRDPDLQARVEDQRRAQRALREPVAPLAASQVDAMVAAALDATHEPHPSVPTVETHRHDVRSTPRRPSARRSGRPSRRRREGFGAGGRSAVPWLVAAAVVLVLALAAVAVPLSRADRSSDTASSASSGDASSGSGSNSSSLRSGAPVTGRAEDGVGTDLGPGTADELAAAALQRVPGPSTSGAASPASPESPAAPAASAPVSGGAVADGADQGSPTALDCAAAILPGAPVLLLGTGRVDGAPVDVVVAGAPPGTTDGPTALVLGPGCTVLARRTA